MNRTSSSRPVRVAPARAALEAIRAHGVLVRLIASYIGLVLVVALTLGTASYLLFQSRYNQELERLHRTYVQNIERDVRREVVDPAKTIFMECATEFLVPSPDFFGEEDEVEGNHGKLFLTHRKLRDLVGKYGRTVNNIHIYYKRADVLVSSSYGLKLDASYYLPAAGEAWITELAGSPAVNRWVRIDESPLDPGAPAFMMVLRFPILSEAAEATVVLAVEFQSTALRSILERLPESEAGMSAVLDAEGRLVTSTSEGQPMDAYLPAASREAAEVASGSVVRRIGGTPSLVTSAALADTGWTVVNVVPSSAIYRRSEFIRLVLILISFAAVALGTLGAVVFSLRIYDPLGKLLRRVGSLVGPQLPPLGKDGENEFAVLGYAIEGLSSRMGALSATLEANRLVIKHDLVTRLLDGEVATMEEFAEAARLLGIGTVHPGYRAGLLIPVGGREGSANPAEAKLLAYRAADEVEKSGGGSVLAAALPDCTVGIVIGESKPEESGRLAETWTADGFLQVPARVVLGHLVSMPTDLVSSFRTATRLASYSYFFPERRLLMGCRDLLEREGTDRRTAWTMLESFLERLRLRHRGEVMSSLSALRDFVRSDLASAAVCRAELRAVSASIVEYARDMKLEAVVPSLEGAVDLVDASCDIDDFIRRVAGLVDGIYAALDARANGRTSAYVEAARRYVEERYASSLSLESAAEAVGLSPGHLSKIFKAETGVTFVSWVSAYRLEHAERLLRGTDKTVHEIGSSCGMNTPAYFIKQFKARYGLTPYDYRRIKRNGGPRSS